ncbi:ABC transporter permease [Sporosarcina sp. NCCP-2716]|uniref:ABC transporter permease n=1 Tax=Sporosarcina sp. NCCP-2716 TaxID=2943679 RepID=UPI00203EE1E0|nr:ABC transporter permease [Sporosarcina sp. NCCP-2716]GKV68618.1 ABC transporter permease [Sporosarcina sp. NCCP-2716]
MSHKAASFFGHSFRKASGRTAYQVLLLLAGLPLHLFTYFSYIRNGRDRQYTSMLNSVQSGLADRGQKEKWLEEYKDQLERKQKFFRENVSPADIHREAEKLADEKLSAESKRISEMRLEQTGQKKETYFSYFQSLLQKPAFLVVSFIPGFFMYVLLFLMSNPFILYIAERLVQSVGVIIGVAVLVFTILYISPFDPATNILGESATQEQISNFNRLHGLDLSYWQQLWNALKGIATFDLGSSFAGNEDVAASISNKFPVTLTIALFSVIMAIVIAIPVGILSATRPNSFLDYSFMFIALIGLSIPNFWQGLIFILGFSIHLNWLPATYSPGHALSLIMPVVVLGTALTASIARMMRSSLLEIINEDYIITARAKGLSYAQTLWRHAIGNAMIPVVTVIGLLFGGMLGGAAVTEKVFNIRGIGSYIVDKQFIPDIPAIMGGVVYIAITISLVNLLIDILYALLDPRIRSKIDHS